MAMYEGKYSSSMHEYKLAERYLYGSSRLGIDYHVVDMYLNAPVTPQVQPINPMEKRFEISNHLGNVLATISNYRIAVPDGSGGIDHYEPEVVNTSDYYPFGSLLKERTCRWVWKKGSNYPAIPTHIELAFVNMTEDPNNIAIEGSRYRFTFNGKENDSEVKGEGNQQDYGMRIYDSRLGRFLSVDPIAKSYPELTPYQFASNHPINARDLDGFEADAKFDGLERQDRIAAEKAGLDGEAANSYIRNRRIARGIGAMTGAVIATSIITAPEIIFLGHRILTVASANPEAAYFVGGVIAGMVYEGPEDLFPQSNGDEVGKYFRSLFKTPIADVGKWLKFSGVTGGKFIKGAKGGGVAIIGQGMKKVEKVAGGFKNAITFDPTEIAEKEWNALVEEWGDVKIPDEIVKGTRMFRENEEWIKDVKDAGYDLLDIGGSNSSTFYNMEKEVVYGNEVEY